MHRSSRLRDGCASHGGRPAVRGGPGMVLKVEPLRSAMRAAVASMPAGSRRVYLGADGRRFEQGMAREAARWPGLILWQDAMKVSMSGSSRLRSTRSGRSGITC